MSGQSFSGLCCPTLVANQLAVFLKDLQQLCCASKRPPPNHTIPPNLWHPSLSFPSQYPDTYLITLSWRNQIEAAQQMLSELLSKCNKKHIHYNIDVNRLLYKREDEKIMPILQVGHQWRMGICLTYLGTQTKIIDWWHWLCELRLGFKDEFFVWVQQK